MKLFLIVIMSLFLVGSVWAEKVVLTNGDSLTGSAVEIKSGKVVVDTGYSDPISIALDQVEKIEFSRPVKVIFKDSNIIETDELIRGKEGFDRIEAANPSPPKIWGLNLALGYGASDGNSNKTSFLAALDGSYLFQELFRLGFSGRYEYGNDKPEGEKRSETSNNGSVQGKADFFLIDNGYCYFLSKYSFDRMKDIKQRLENGPGLGYDLIKCDSGYIGIELGSSYIHTEYEDTTSAHGLYFRLGQNAQWQINSLISLTQNLSYQPKAEDFNTYLIDGEATIKFSLTEALYLGLVLSDRYDSDPVNGKTPNDLSLYVSLGYAL